MKNRKKGISPLIAAVLLIAFVIAVGGILSGWFTSFTKTTVEDTRAKGEQEIKCAYANLWIQSAHWDGLNKLSLVVDNTGTENLEGFKMIIIFANYSTKNLEVLPETTLAPGDVESFYNETGVGACSDIDTVIFKSETCPVEGKDEIKKSDITDC